MNKIRIVTHQDFRLHGDDSIGHPERPRRLELALEGVSKAGFDADIIGCRENPWNLFSSVHDRGYIAMLERRIEEARLYGASWIDPDTYVTEGTLQALEALACSVNEIISGVDSWDYQVLIARPPGHHAGRSGPALGAPTLGFCIVNTAALLAELLHGRLNVAVLDFDVHHGNGTQEILGPTGITHVDIHQDPRTIYPGTGYPEEAGPSGSWYNIAVPPGAGDDIFFDAFETALRILDHVDPDIVVISMGYDGMKGDNYLASTLASPMFYARIGADLASRDWKIIAVLEGGYGIGLVDGLSHFLSGLAGRLRGVRPDTLSDDDVWRYYRSLLSRAHWLSAHA